MSAAAQVPTAKVGVDGPETQRIGFGLMGLSIGYGEAPNTEERLKVLDHAWETGALNWDTADCYGDSEDLVGEWFRRHPERRGDIYLATKFALRRDPEAPLGLSPDSSPEYARAACEKSLKRLGVEHIDLYYIHRLDTTTPVEKTIEALVQLKNEGKIRQIGISECSSSALRRAHAVHPIAAVQVEYNPWDPDIEGPAGTNLLQTARELGTAVFAYSPLGRGILTGRYRSADDFEEGDSRRWMDRYRGDNLARNLELVARFEAIARRKGEGVTAGQVALAWLLAQGEDIFPIPGTKKTAYLDQNMGAAALRLTPDEEKEVRRAVGEATPAGHRTPMFGCYADSAPL